MIEEAKKVGEKSEHDYNPYDHRVVKKPNSDIRSTANLIKSSLGTGLLAVPLAFSNAGWGIGLLGTVIIGFICAHCVYIFVKVSLDCCKIQKEPLLGYSETCQSAFENGLPLTRPLASTARVFAEFALSFTYIAVCCVYTVLIADSLKQIIDQYFPSTIIDVQMYCLMLIIPLAVVCQIKHLKWLAPFSLLANILLILVFLICLYYIFSKKLVIQDKRVVGEASRFPAFLSTVIFAMEGIGVVMPVENTMKKPSHFLGCPGVLIISMIIVTFLYATLGLFGYFRYGDELKGSITLNLPVDDWPAVCGKVFIILAIFFTYALQFYVAIEVFWKRLQPKLPEKYHTVSEIVLRMVVLIICVAIAIAIPMLEQIISIVGAFFYSLLGIIIPCLVESVFYWDNLGRFNWMLWKNIILIIFGFGALFSGCSLAISDILAIVHNK